MYTKDRPISLANMKEGAIIEAFDHELQEVWKNIMDPNTTGAARTITLTVTLTPGKKSRELVDIKGNVAKKLAPVAPVETSALVGEGENGVEAAELIEGQMRLDEAAGNVAPITSSPQGGVL